MTQPSDLGRLTYENERTAGIETDFTISRSCVISVEAWNNQRVIGRNAN